jgi:CheY-like chemotaxis protein
MKILYVEDTLLNLCLVERIARMGSHEVINYASAEQAFRNFEQDKPNLVLVDIRLEGEMSGVELIQRLRSAGHRQPIVVITAIVTDEMRERCLLVGANDYFTKPVAVRDLLHIIQRHEKALSEPSNEPPTELPKESPTEPAQESPKETPKETPKDASKAAPEAVAETVTEAAAPVQSPLETHLKPEEQPPDQPDRTAATKQAVL